MAVSKQNSFFEHPTYHAKPVVKKIKTASNPDLKEKKDLPKEPTDWSYLAPVFGIAVIVV